MDFEEMERRTRELPAPAALEALLAGANGDITYTLMERLEPRLGDQAMVAAALTLMERVEMSSEQRSDLLGMLLEEACREGSKLSLPHAERAVALLPQAAEGRAVIDAMPMVVDGHPLRDAARAAYEQLPPAGIDWLFDPVMRRLEQPAQAWLVGLLGAPAIEALLEFETWWTPTLRALVRLPTDDRVIDRALREARRTRDGETLIELARLLSRSERPDSTDALSNLIDHPEERVREVAREALTARGASTVSPWRKCPLAGELIEQLRRLGASFAPSAPRYRDPLDAFADLRLRGVRRRDWRSEYEFGVRHAFPADGIAYAEKDGGELEIIAYGDGGNMMLVIFTDGDRRNPDAALVDHDDPDQSIHSGWKLSEMLRDFEIPEDEDD